MSPKVIRVENLSKQYRLGAFQGYKTFRESLVNAVKLPFRYFGKSDAQSAVRNTRSETIWALNSVSFEVQQGEVVGIIGRNGAGKSTLLKVLSKITEPTLGRVELKGRVGSLLEVGTGFHPELTGHENIYLYGAILGMDRWEVTRKFDEIVAFAGLEKFIETPVKRYSSGMYMRLAFAVAANLETEILLVDEVLAVGDAAFQQKCLGKMEDVTNQGRTVLFVSHNMAAIQKLCQKTAMLKDGIIKSFGLTDSVVSKYLSDNSERMEMPLSERTDRRGNGNFLFTSIEFLNANQQILDYAPTGKTLNIRLGYCCKSSVEMKSLRISIGFRNMFGQLLFTCPSDVVLSLKGNLTAEGYLVCSISKLPLQEGEYYFNLFSAIGDEISDWIEDAGELRVQGGDFYGTGRFPPHTHKGVLIDYKWRPS
jgi:lipopolysaccharide transport system ATP-binding protein